MSVSWPARWWRMTVAVAVTVAGLGPAPADRWSLPTSAPDLILHGGVIHTIDPKSSTVQAIAVRDGQIVALGRDSTVLDLAAPWTQVVDLDGRTVLPGIVDPHVHLIQQATAGVKAKVGDQRTLLSNGRTTVGIPGLSEQEAADIADFVATGRARLRMVGYTRYNDPCGAPSDGWWRTVAYRRTATVGLTLAGLKVFLDGGVCGAAAASWSWPDGAGLPPAWTGVVPPYLDPAQVAAVVGEAGSLDAQVVFHAQGDEAVRVALDGLDMALGGVNPLGHRIDHNSFLAPDLIGRYETSDVDAVVWGNFDTCVEAPLWESTVPADRLGYIGANRQLLEANPSVAVAFHSDAPYTDVDPFASMLSLTTFDRLDPTGGLCTAPPWLAGNTVPIEAALRMMTISAAVAMGVDEQVGSLEIGKQADLVVLGRDPLAQSGVELLDNAVLATVVQGHLAWCAPSSPLCAELPAWP